MHDWQKSVKSALIKKNFKHEEKSIRFKPNRQNGFNDCSLRFNVFHHKQ